MEIVDRTGNKIEILKVPLQSHVAGNKETSRLHKLSTTTVSLPGLVTQTCNLYMGALKWWNVG